VTRSLRLDRSGASAAEFALVLPLLILFLFGIIDGGRYLWEVNKAEKATQVGARVAVVTAAIPGGLVAESYVGNTAGGTALTQGDLIPRAALGEITCTKSGGSLDCSCTTNPCPDPLTPIDTTGFDLMADRMRYMKPDIADEDIRIRYSGSGLGFAGDPNGMEIAPLVTVELQNVAFDPLMLFGMASFNLPAFRTTLTAEDSAGDVSN
jgi:hypothetical protein